MRVLIAGCGYVGLALGARLTREGHEVFGLRRTHSADAEFKNVGIHAVTADITALQDLERLPGRFDWVVNTVSSNKGGIEDYRRVYLDGMRNLIAWLERIPPEKFVYTSSTSVYGQTDGSVVDETSPTESASETSQVLLEAERMLLAASQRAHETRKKSQSDNRHPGPLPSDQSGRSRVAVQDLPGVILRVAAIYGPGRGHWFQQYLQGKARIENKGERFLNMIHRDDLAGSIVAALKAGRPGEIYNAVDDEPVSQLEFFCWLSEKLGGAMPPFQPAGEKVARKRGVTNKRVSNQKLREQLGYDFQYPTFREGLQV